MILNSPGSTEIRVSRIGYMPMTLAKPVDSDRLVIDVVLKGPAIFGAHHNSMVVVVLHEKIWTRCRQVCVLQNLS